MIDSLNNLMAIMIIASVVIIGCLIFMQVKQRQQVVDMIHAITSDNQWVDARTFMEKRQVTNGHKKLIVSENEFCGVYIIFNKTQGIYYVGQGTKAMQRCAMHFRGSGNGDIYADYKYGNKFLITFIKLTTSGYDSLDALEKDTIEAYDAYKLGYNKTKGNG